MLKEYVKSKLLKVIGENDWEFNAEEVENAVDHIIGILEGFTGLDSEINGEFMVEQGYADTAISEWEDDVLKEML